MSEKGTKDVKAKKDMGKIRIIFSAMILFVLLIAEIYMMIHSTEYFVYLVTVTVLMIAVLYILLASVMQVNYEKQLQMNEVFEDIFKSEKASYLLMRKNFEELEERLAVIEDNMKTPTEEIIEAQKAIAKVSISRNRENADALMNSNDKLLDKIIDFEAIMYSNNDKIIEQQKALIEQANREVLMKYQEGLSKIREVELSIKNEILQSANKISSIQPQIVVSAPQMAQIPQPMPETMQQESVPDQSQIQPFEPAEEITDSNIMDGFNFMEEPDMSMESELSFDNLLKQSKDNLSVDDSLFDEISPKESDLSDDMSLLNSMLGQEISVGDSLTENPLEEESVVEENPLEEEELLSEEEPVMENEPLVEEGSVMEEGPLVGEEPAIEEEPIVVEEPVEEVVEEKPPMPDLSNPNKIMTPDEIAALLANL